MKQKGLVTKVFSRHYQLSQNFGTFEGVGCFEAPRVHRVQLRIEGFGKGLGSEVLVSNSNFKVTVTRYANCCMVHVDCKGSYSFDPGAFLAVVECVKARLENPPNSAIKVLSPEFNFDYYGIQITDAKGVSFSDFMGNFERIYQKGDVVRSEARVNGAYPIEQVYALLKGGMHQLQIIQGVGLLTAKLDQLTEAMKYHNELEVKIAKYMKAIVERGGQR